MPKTSETCRRGGTILTPRVSEYSLARFSIPLCWQHQQYARNSTATKESLTLYALLKEAGIPAQFEKFDGHKTIDIAIPDLFLNIEVDGAQHRRNKRQRQSDKLRDEYSARKGFATFRVSNELVRGQARGIVDAIMQYALKRKNRRHFA
jgi:very-short-patch-repair endonuclease